MPTRSSLVGIFLSIRALRLNFSLQIASAGNKILTSQVSRFLTQHHPTRRWRQGGETAGGRAVPLLPAITAFVHSCTSDAAVEPTRMYSQPVSTTYPHHRGIAERQGQSLRHMHFPLAVGMVVIFPGLPKIGLPIQRRSSRQR